jgi:aminopeptidase N
MRRHLTALAPTGALAAALMATLLAGCTPAPPPSPPPAPETSYSNDFSRYEAGLSNPVADTVYPGRGNPGIDVLHYGLDLTWAPDSRTLTGTAILHLRAATTLPTLTLDFASAYTTGEVTLDGQPVPATVTRDKLEVATSLTAGQNATLRVSYHGTPKVTSAPTGRTDFSSLGLRVTADGSLWTMQEPFGAFTWYPVNDHPSDKALYDLAITVPDGWSGIAGGTPAGVTRNTFRYTYTDPVASYLTTLAAGRYRKETATGPRGLPLTYWYVNGRDADMMRVARESPRYLAWIEAKFGPYPFPTAGVVIVPATSAMETQQLVTIGPMNNPSVSNLDNYREGVLVHEYLHHWFGDTVTTSSWNSLWLNEGWAMYGQYLFENERDGIAMTNWERGLRESDAALRKRFGPPGKADPADFGRSNMYVCPALMLHQIRKRVGDDAFFALARDWVSEHRNTVQDRASFTAFVNRHTGQNLTALIGAWLDSPTTPA